MLGPRLRQMLAVSASAALVALTVLAAPVSAGDSRIVYFGSPAADGGSNGTVTYTQTHPGGYTITNILARNDGTQTLNHVILLGGTAADAAPDNALYPAPPPPSLPSDLAYIVAFSDGVCDVPASNPDLTAYHSLRCDLGQLPAGASTTISVVIKTSDATTATQTWYGLYLSETNSTGSNQDNFYATGTVATTTATCGGNNSDANYFLAGSNVDLSTAQNCVHTGQQVASIRSGSSVSGRGGFSSVTIGDAISNDCAAIGYTCYGDAIVADVLDASEVPGGLQWTVTWYGTRSISGVIHFWDSYDPTTHPNDYTVIPFDKKHQCATSSQRECWTSTSRSNGSADPLWFMASFVTDHNKVITGW